MPDTRLADLASEMGVPYRSLRHWVRYRWPRNPGDLYAPWFLTDEQVSAARAAFPNRARRPPPGPIGAHAQLSPRPSSSDLTQEPPRVLTPKVAASAPLNAVREALRMRAQADRMLAALSVTRNGFDLVGQLAELLVARAFGGELADSGMAGYDVLLPNGTRLQVKGRMGIPGELGKQVFMRGLGGGARPFDELVFVQFATAYELERAARFGFEVIAPLAAYVPHTNSWRLRMGPDLLALGADVTEIVRQAFDRL